MRFAICMAFACLFFAFAMNVARANSAHLTKCEVERTSHHLASTHTGNCPASAVQWGCQLTINGNPNDQGNANTRMEDWVVRAVYWAPQCVQSERMPDGQCRFPSCPYLRRFVTIPTAATGRRPIRAARKTTKSPPHPRTMQRTAPATIVRARRAAWGFTTRTTARAGPTSLTDPTTRNPERCNAVKSRKILRARHTA